MLLYTLHRLNFLTEYEVRWHCLSLSQPHKYPVVMSAPI